MEETKFEVLQKMCEPIVDYLKENHHPHTSIVITDSSIRMQETTVFVPIEKGD